MDTKHLIAAALIFIFTGMGVLAASCSQRLRDLMFFMLVLTFGVRITTVAHLVGWRCRELICSP